MIPLSIRQNRINYTSGSGQTLTMFGAVVIRTNGMNNYLLSMELNKNSPLITNLSIKKWPLFSKKTYKFLNSLNNETILNVDCEYTIGNTEEIEIVDYKYNLSLITEKCKNEKISFENKYWIDEKGFIWKSVQWLGKKNIAQISIINPPM